MIIDKPDNIYGGITQRIWVSYRKADIFVRKFEINTEVLIGGEEK
jgi:hypothetical protein